MYGVELFQGLVLRANEEIWDWELVGFPLFDFDVKQAIKQEAIYSEKIGRD